MRVLATLHPGTGHLNPLVPLLLALRESGDDVLVATAASFVAEVERAGLPAVAAGRDWRESDAATTLPGFLDATTVGQLGYFLDLAAEAADDLTALVRSHRADVVLRESTEFGGWVAALRTGVPHVEAGIIAPVGAPLLSVLAGDAFARLLDRVGLPPDPALDSLSDLLHLDPLPASFSPPWLAPPQTRVGYRRAQTYDGAGPSALPDWWADVIARPQPLVYVTLGTVYNQAADVFRRILDGLAPLDVQVVVATGRDLDPAELDPLPSHVRAARYLPQSVVVPHADVVVCHAGCGTVLDCLAAGVPLVALPFGADQPLNALRVAELGLGVSLADTDVPGSPAPRTDVGALDPARVRDAVERVLTDPSYRQAAALMRDELSQAMDVAAAAEAVQAAVSTAPHSPTDVVAARLR